MEKRIIPTQCDRTESLLSEEQGSVISQEPDVEAHIANRKTFSVSGVQKSVFEGKLTQAVEDEPRSVVDEIMNREIAVEERDPLDVDGKLRTNPNDAKSPSQSPHSLLIDKDRISSPYSHSIESITLENFKSLLLDSLKSHLQQSLRNFHPHLNELSSRIRQPITLPNNARFLTLLKECLCAQLNRDCITNLNDGYRMSLAEGLQSVLSEQVSHSLSHLLIQTDVSKITESTMQLWCDCIETNYPDRLVVPKENRSLVEPPSYYMTSRFPFSRFFCLSINEKNSSNPPSQWLLRYLNDSRNPALKQDYFCDWFFAQLPSHLHRVVSYFPFDFMSTLVNSLFIDPNFITDWLQQKECVLTALEFMNVTASCGPDIVHFRWNAEEIRTWTELIAAAIKSSSAVLGESAFSLSNTERLLHAITSLEINQALFSLLKDYANLLLGLKITKFILLFAETRHSGTESSPRYKACERLRSFLLDALVKPLVNDSFRGVDPSDIGIFVNGILLSRSEEELFHLINHSIGPGSILPRQASKLFVASKVFPSLLEHILESSILFYDHHDLQIIDAITRDAESNLSRRCMVVILKSLLNASHGVRTIDTVLMKLSCNSIKNLTPNGKTFLEALVFCVESSLPSSSQLSPEAIDISVAFLRQPWSFDRIHQLCILRQQLSRRPDDSLLLHYIKEWDRHRRQPEEDCHLVDQFLHFLLHFSSGTKDPMCSSNAISHF